MQKYQFDNEWFMEKKGFSIEDMGRVTKSIIEIQLEKLSIFHAMQFDKKLEELTTLNLFMFSVEEIIKKTSWRKRNYLVKICNTSI